METLKDYAVDTNKLTLQDFLTAISIRIISLCGLIRWITLKINKPDFP